MRGAPSQEQIANEVAHDYKEDVARLAQQVGYLKASLQMIADLPAGSRGAYGKFSEAQEMANRALAKYGRQR